MTISKTFILLAIITHIICGQEISVEISLEKDVYEVGEPIIVMTLIKNNSINDYIFTYTMNGQYTFKIEDYNKNIIEGYLDKLPVFIFNREICLKPGEFINHFTDLGSGYGNLPFAYPLFSSFKAGSYSIQLSFGDRLIANNNDTLRNNLISSNNISFKIIPSSSLLKNVLETIKNEFDKGNSEKYISSLKTNIEKTNFSNLGYLFICRYIPTLPVESNKEISNLIIQYPNNYWSAQFSYRCKDLISLDDPKIKGTILWQALKSDFIWDREMMKNKSKYFIQEKDKK